MSLYSTDSDETVVTLDISECIWYHNQHDYKKAFNGFQRHAKSGNAIAQFFVGYYLYTGAFSYDKNEQVAGIYLQSAAEKGLVPAQLWYAHSCIMGTLNEPEIALEFILRASKKGNLYALLWYGDIVARGEYGITKDLLEGERLYRLALEQGHPLASLKLKLLKKE